MAKHNVTKQASPRKARSRALRDKFQGTTAIYVMEPDGYADAFVGDYDAEATLETWPGEIRADRARRKREGKAVARLHNESLRDRVLIAFGPLVSPEHAVAALEQAIKSITKDGLLIGSDQQGSIAWEQVDGSVKV